MLYKHKYSTKDGITESDSWYYRFMREGKTYVGSTGCSNKTQAARFEEKKKRDVDAALIQGDVKTITIRKAFDTYLDTIKRDGKFMMVNSRLNKMVGTMTDKRTKKPITVFGFDSNRHLHTLTDADVQQLVMERRKYGNANGTILAELASLSQVIVMIKKLGYLVPTISFAEIKKDNKVRPSTGRVRWLSKDEEELLLVNLDPNNDQIGTGGVIKFAQRQDAYDLAVLLFDLGARYGEVAKLEWKDIDLTNGSVILWRTKVQNGSTLYLTKRSIAVLQRRLKDKRDDQVYVFEAKDGTARKYAPGPFQSAFKRAGIAGATIHTIRHSNASKLVQNGVTTQELAQLYGHSSTKTTEIYAHLAPLQSTEKARAILNKLDN